MNKFNTADLCDDNSLIIAKPIFKSYGSRTHYFGKIKTVEAIEDNSYIKRLLQEDGSGCVMVVDGRGSEKCALVGDNLAALGAENNWSGIIVNGCNELLFSVVLVLLIYIYKQDRRNTIL